MKDGDDDAHAEFYCLYFDRVYRYLWVALRDPHEAEDATHEVFIRVFRALGTFEFTDTPFKVWLFRVVRNYALSCLERRRRILVTDPTALSDLRGAAISVGVNHPWQEFSDGRLVLAIERLPRTQQQVLFLRYVLDLDWNETAAVLGRSPGSARMLQQRALATLGARMAALVGSADAMSDTRRFAVTARSLPRFSPVLCARKWGIGLAPGS
jgi:RNA polymerase sigma-70 factor (ECF subfamily)